MGFALSWSSLVLWWKNSIIPIANSAQVYLAKWYLQRQLEICAVQRQASEVEPFCLKSASWKPSSPILTHAMILLIVLLCSPSVLQLWLINESKKQPHQKVRNHRIRKQAFSVTEPVRHPVVVSNCNFVRFLYLWVLYGRIGIIIVCKLIQIALCAVL